MTKPLHTVQGRGDGASRDAAASENSVAREERTRESETRANERPRIFPFPVREREREDLFTMEDINNYKRKRIMCTPGLLMDGLGSARSAFCGSKSDPGPKN